MVKVAFVQDLTMVALAFVNVTLAIPAPLSLNRPLIPDNIVDEEKRCPTNAPELVATMALENTMGDWILPGIVPGMIFGW